MTSFRIFLKPLSPRRKISISFPRLLLSYFQAESWRRNVGPHTWLAIPELHPWFWLSSFSEWWFSDVPFTITFYNELPHWIYYLELMKYDIKYFWHAPKHSGMVIGSIASFSFCFSTEASIPRGPSLHLDGQSKPDYRDFMNFMPPNQPLLFTFFLFPGSLQAEEPNGLCRLFG